MGYAIELGNKGPMTFSAEVSETICGLAIELFL